MKKIFLLLLLFLGMGGLNLLQADPAMQVNEKMFLPVSTRNAINYLTSHNYVLVNELTKNKTLFLTTPKNSDVTVLISSPSSFSKINAVAVQVLLSKDSLKPDSKTSSDSFNILTESTFQLIAKSLAFLPCANQADFLRNGFVCENTYKVQYTLYEGGMNGLRKWLGVTENKQIVIKVIPVPKTTSAATKPPSNSSNNTLSNTTTKDSNSTIESNTAKTNSNSPQTSNTNEDSPKTSNQATNNSNNKTNKDSKGKENNSETKEDSSTTSTKSGK